MSCNISHTINSEYSRHGCNTVSPDWGGRGVTYWAYPNGTSYTLSPTGSKTITFTCTEPYCYEGGDWCNVHFKATPKGSAAYNRLSFSVNSAYTQDMYLSGVPDNGMWQTYELANLPNDTYHDDKGMNGMNTIVLTNNSSGTIEVSGFRILRSYAMKHYNYSTIDGCSLEVDHGSSGSLDTLRADFPCHLTYCGRRSVNTARDYVTGSTIPAGGCAEWVFNWASHTSANYETQDVTLFNFNQLAVTQTDTYQTDVTLSAYLNGSPLTTFYLSKLKPSQSYHPAFPSYDLAANPNYNDTGANTVKLVNNSAVPVQFQDGYGINIYRVYKTASICPPSCESCNVACEASCQTSCEASCQSGCFVSCLACYSCYVGCQEGCEVECQNCQSACELSCQNCQTCQTTCQVSCDNCQLCVSCQESESCPSGYYECQNCETCQPSYT